MKKDMQYRCCQNPPEPTGPFADSLREDAEQFSKFVGGGDFRYLASALHLEMKLWPAGGPLPDKYRANDARWNSWRAMSNRTTAPETEYSRFDPAHREKGLDALSSLQPASLSCVLKSYDEFVIKLIVDERKRGLKQAGVPLWDPQKNKKAKPPELGTIGLAQKRVNLFIKYEFCWQYAGQWRERELAPYEDHAIPNLLDYQCALHAPMDRELISAINRTDVGKTLKRNGFLVGEAFVQADGKNRPWSKLDCLRTYYGFQLLLRHWAMDTWPEDCACASPEDLIKSSVEWFENKFDGKCTNHGKDWLKAARREFDKSSRLKTIQKGKPLRAVEKNTKNKNGCASCRLAETVVRAHECALNNRVNLPFKEIGELSFSHSRHRSHRIVIGESRGIMWQYHIYEGFIKVDLFMEKEFVGAYDHIRGRLKIKEHEFPDGFTGNGNKGGLTRSIFKYTDHGASSGTNSFEDIAKQAVKLMEEVFRIRQHLPK